MSGKQLRRREEAQRQRGPQSLPGPHPRGSVDPAEGSEAGGGGGAAFGGGALSGLPGEGLGAGPLTGLRHPPC